MAVGVEELWMDGFLCKTGARYGHQKVHWSENQKKMATSTGLEPARANPRDF
jgi:hypothetical protein